MSMQESDSGEPLLSPTNTIIFATTGGVVVFAFAFIFMIRLVRRSKKGAKKMKQSNRSSDFILSRMAENRSVSGLNMSLINSKGALMQESRSLIIPSTFSASTMQNSPYDGSSISNTMEKTIGNSFTFGSSNTPVFIPGYLMLDYQNDISLDNNLILGQGGTAKIFMGKFQNLALIAKYGNLDLVPNCL